MRTSNDTLGSMSIRQQKEIQVKSLRAGARGSNPNLLLEMADSRGDLFNNRSKLKSLPRELTKLEKIERILDDGSNTIKINFPIREEA